MNYLDSYRKIIIEPLEELKKEVIKNYIKSFFFKKHYEKLLDKIEIELIKKYYEMSVDEFKFQEYINKQIES